MTSFSLFAFLVALTVSVINGVIVKAVLGIWLPDDRAKLAAFAFLVGLTAGMRGQDFALIAGVLLGLVLLFWLFFRREKAVA